MLGGHQRQPLRTGLSGQPVEGPGLPPTEDTVPRLRGIAASGRGDAIVRTLEQADVDTRRFAQAAAVLDHEDFTVPLAAKLAAVRDGNVDAVVASLRESRILDRKEPPGFVHPTIATAIYQRMSPATKTAMHGAAVQVLKDAGKPLSVMSRHLIETYPEDDPQVVEMLQDAADEHLAMGAPRPPCAAWSARWRSRRSTRTTRRSASNSAGPCCSPTPPPPWATCARPWTPGTGSPQTCARRPC
ncbi:hypothetical protein ACFQZC_21070 [Streptacidiphilus monticola]